MSTHTGTHIDAPFHFDEEGKRVIDLDLDLYIGQARVLCLPHPKQIGIEELQSEKLEGVTRLLIRTDTWSDRSAFPGSIPPVAPDVAPFLAEKGIRLLGLDLPSVDPLDSERTSRPSCSRPPWDSHPGRGCVGWVEPGDYQLVALPLPLTQADGSPVRAVLKRLE